MSLASGSRIGPYEIIAPLGAGGMGAVYRARDTRLQRDVAVKVLSEGAVQDRTRLKRFLAEARSASSLNHPNILTIHEIGESEAGPYIVMEMIDGRTVRDLMAGGLLPAEKALDIAIQAADGLAKAHDAGILHRDVKPENLMVTTDGFVKILDFGLAKLMQAEQEKTADQSLTASGMLLGTPGYLSPEQLFGTPPDQRSDVFSLGVVLYEMLSGKNPFRGPTAESTLRALLYDSPPALTGKVDLPHPGLSGVVMKALAKSPAERYPSARVFAEVLRRSRTGTLTRAEIDAACACEPPAARPSPGRKWLTAGAWVLGLAVAALIVGLALRELTPRAPAEAQVTVDIPRDRLAVAVIPFKDETGDPADVGKILSDGIGQVLGDVPQFYVLSQIRLDGVCRDLRKSFADLATDNVLARTVSRRSQAGAMLTGTLSRFQDKYVLSANLTAIPSDRNLGTFVAESGSRDMLLKELTTKISQAIREKFSPSAAPESLVAEPMPSTSLDAYAHLVRGRDLTYESQWQEAIAELNRAIALDPNLALAYSELSCAYSFAGDEARSEAAFRKARELEGNLNVKERQWLRFNEVWLTGNGTLYVQVASQFARDYPDDRQGYFYAGLGEEYLNANFREAIRWYEQAYRLTPRYYPITKAIADCQEKLGRKDEAVRMLRRFLALPVISPESRASAEGRLKELEG